MAKSSVEISESSLVRLQFLGRRLAGELGAIIEAVAEPMRTARGLAKTLGVDRGTAQRALVAARLTSEPLEALARGPGVAALRQIAKGAQDGGVHADAVRALSAATDQIESTLRELGISQAALMRSIDPEPAESSQGWSQGSGASVTFSGGAGNSDPVEQRRRLFEAAAEALGRAMESRTIVMITRPKQGDPSKVEIFGAHGVIGYRARPDAMPMVLGKTVETPGTVQPAGVMPQLLSGERPMMDFCTQPLALVTSRQRGREVHAVIEPRSPDEAVDVVLASKAPDDDENSKHFGKVQETRFNIRVPTRAAVFDMYLERSLAQNCVPSLDLYLWPREGRSPRPSTWYDALPGAPLLAVLGQGIRHSASQFYARQSELTAATFEAAGWNPDLYVGYRCQVAYPHWASCYAMNFDYRPVPGDE